MYVNASLTQYHLPLFRIAATGGPVELGTDTRSIFVRPITAVGEATADGPASGLLIAKDPAGEDYRQWQARTDSYRLAATGGDPAPSATEPDPAPADPDAAPGGQGPTSGGSDQPAAAGDTPPQMVPPPAEQPSAEQPPVEQPAVEPPAQQPPADPASQPPRQSGLGKLLSGLFGG